ncbi:glutathione S-transferase [Globomyces pollinis-pini]|nr:glutathione S-transferase [Globomyces pollinis-pini]
MSIGKIYTYPNNYKVYQALIAAKYNHLNVEEVHIQLGVDNKSKEFLAKFPLGKVPAFESNDGFHLVESNAITHFIADVEGTTLYGKNKKEIALVHQFVHVASNEFLYIQAAWLYPVLGYLPADPPSLDRAKAQAKRILLSLNKHLSNRTFLVGDRITLADISLSMTLLDFYKNVFDSEFTSDVPNVTRWFRTCINQSQFRLVIGDVVICPKMREP